MQITKATAYTLDQTKDIINKVSERPDVVILHSLTNEVKNNNPNDTLHKLQDVIKLISNKWQNIKTVVSLSTPRTDNRICRVNSEIIDGLVKREFMDKQDVYVSDNGNMWHGSIPISHLLKSDKFHLTERGISLLASNIKNALHTVLSIKSQQKTKYWKNNYGYYYKPKGQYTNGQFRWGNHYNNGW